MCLLNLGYNDSKMRKKNNCESMLGCSYPYKKNEHNAFFTTLHVI